MLVGTQSLWLPLFLKFSPTLDTGLVFLEDFHDWNWSKFHPRVILQCKSLQIRSPCYYAVIWKQFSIGTKNHSFIFHSIKKAKLHFANHTNCIFSTVNGKDHTQGLSWLLFLLGKWHGFWGRRSYYFRDWIWVSINHHCHRHRSISFASF